MEYDEFDSYACHVLVRHKASGVVAGCTRLIPTRPEDPAAPLPLEKYCRDSLNIKYLDSLNLPRLSISEASRLAISSQFRRRRGEQESRFGISGKRNYSLEELRTFPLVSVAISLATTALTELLERPCMLAMMEPFLPRLLRRVGYNFVQVGRNTDYHGMRAAYYVETRSVLENLRPELVDLYSEIRGRLGAFSGQPNHQSCASTRLAASNL
jgi:N-acyl amino acid synthase of PEP-CTERM/exosortase system